MYKGKNYVGTVDKFLFQSHHKQGQQIYKNNIGITLNVFHFSLSIFMNSVAGERIGKKNSVPPGL